MKEYFPILSHYNTVVNGALYDIVDKLPPEKFRENVGSFFKSISGVLNHIYAADVLWLQRLKKTVTGLTSLAGPELEVTISIPAGEIHTELNELRKRRVALDAVLEAFTEELSESNLLEVADYTNSRGERHRYVVWQALMHLFNHQTHHRGQVAEILDQFGVANDYSNVVATLREPPLPQ